MTNIYHSIQETRSEMIKLANKHGYTSKQALECSQKLDHLLNVLMHNEEGNREKSNN
ncbi:aspartyl-phosphate phosphatase Spo0E family protein [Cytobacillus purgationiresistens]|uniref:Aspartyl-phosphate phosphatase Spo0E family protein n=1 Tax=Cytobacillus purgationiresistens TaxID=863449 RepID=A0ABU0APD9_9BACI|nr:aspartyl-phosphate phosphatase Spo0E family protein [Cytobacillus purgationiresistens]MDQ0272632.1 hypothetical protein [Cytobacillus purgationiresistens]